MLLLLRKKFLMRMEASKICVLPECQTLWKESSGLVARGGGDTLGICGWGCAAGTLEPLTHTRASSAEF